MFHRHLNLRVVVILLIFVLAFSVNSQAGPQFYNYENVGSPNLFPFCYAPEGRLVSWLFLPGDFSQPTPLPAGNEITDVYFFLGDGGSQTYTDLIIKMAQDDITTFTMGQFYPGPLETVYYNSSVTLSGTSDSWLAITLDTPYSYDPTRSLILSAEHSGAAGYGMTVRQNGLPNVRRVMSNGGPPFVPSSGGDGSVVNFGVDISPVIPAPGAVLLGGIGIGLVNWLRRRRTI